MNGPALSQEDIRARVVLELRRAGLVATDEQIAAVVRGYGQTQQLLADLRAWLGDAPPEPAVTFSAGAANGERT